MITVHKLKTTPLFATLHERLGEHYLRVQPNGYEFPIVLPVITSGSREQARAWTWNGDLEKPTLKPSVKTTHADGKISHIWLTNGICQHLADSTDGLAGQTLPLLCLASDPDNVEVCDGGRKASELKQDANRHSQH